MCDLKVYFLLFTYLAVSCAQIHQFGQCKDVKTVKFFDVEKFQGKWYEISRYQTTYEQYSTCAYKIIEACGRRIVIQHGFIKAGIHFVLHENSSFAPGDEAVFNIQPSNIDPIGVQFSVVETDYDNYAIVTGCKYDEELDVRYITAWILSRQSTLPDDLYEKVEEIFNSTPNLNRVYLEKVEQEEKYCSFAWTADVQSVVIENEK